MDYGINRRSQRVVSVQRITLWCGSEVKVDIAVDKIFTVEDFMDCCPIIYGTPMPGITLKELPDPKCACGGRPMAYPLHAFRPIDSKPHANEREVEKLKGLVAGIDPQRTPEPAGGMFDSTPYRIPDEVLNVANERADVWYRLKRRLARGLLWAR